MFTDRALVVETALKLRSMPTTVRATGPFALSYTASQTLRRYLVHKCTLISAAPTRSTRSFDALRTKNHAKIHVN